MPVDHPDYYQALGAVNVLSGGMGARLFTEIREKEGLCYSVCASYLPMKDRGAVMGYAASLNHQAPADARQARRGAVPPARRASAERRWSASRSA